MRIAICDARLTWGCVLHTLDNAPRETEIALVIRSPHAEQIADAIAQLKTLGRYQLTPASPRLLRDVYFDTRDGALQARWLSLRIRASNAKRFITLKGSLGQTEQDVPTRLEIELAWSHAAFARIARELRARGIALARADVAYRHADPMGTFTRAGLRIVQNRVTLRRARNIIGATGRAQAELAIDMTTFFFGKRVVHLREVEIEAKSAHARIGEMARQLETQFAPALQPWHTKLATGKAIEVLLKQGALQELLDAKNNLTPAALDRINRHLKWEMEN